MDSNPMGPFNEETQRSKILAGYKGGPFNSPLALPQDLEIKPGFPASVYEKLNSAGIPEMTMLDPWVTRYPGSKMK